MKKFQFSLESVFEHRVRLEREALHQLGLELEKQVRARRQLEQASGSIDSCHREMQKLMTQGKLTPSSMQNHHAFLHRLQERENDARREFDEARQRVNKSREEYYRKKSQTEILLKLRERSHAEYLKKLEKLEARETDDLVVVRHSREGMRAA